jgi:hypothetical protein
MAASSLFGGKHATFWINQRYFSPSKVCGFHRIGVRHAPFGCAPYSVLLCDMRRFMHLSLLSFFSMKYFQYSQYG